MTKTFIFYFFFVLKDFPTGYFLSFGPNQFFVYWQMFLNIYFYFPGGIIVTGRQFHAANMVDVRTI